LATSSPPNVSAAKDSELSSSFSPSIRQMYPSFSKAESACGERRRVSP
jgi:hypothetical protein